MPSGYTVRRIFTEGIFLSISIGRTARARGSSTSSSRAEHTKSAMLDESVSCGERVRPNLHALPDDPRQQRRVGYRMSYTKTRRAPRRRWIKGSTLSHEPPASPHPIRGM